MKVLYVSDLDGTLLNQKEELDSEVVDQINQLIEQGVNFTISTGRGDSIRTILKEVHFKLPAMILNGTLNYDFAKKEYVNKKLIPNEKALEIIRLLNDFPFKTFEIQTIIDSGVSRFGISKWNQKSDCLALNLVVTGENKTEIFQILNKIEGINFFLNRKVYSDNEWFCDIVLENVSKASSLKELKEQYGFDKVIAFGDSENDLPLLEVADEFYAVENAADIVKQKATGLIGSCLEHGVVKFISQQNKIF